MKNPKIARKIPGASIKDKPTSDSLVIVASTGDMQTVTQTPCIVHTKKNLEGLSLIESNRESPTDLFIRENRKHPKRDAQTIKKIVKSSDLGSNR